MIKLLHKLPRKRIIALSGGSDSIAAYDFCKRYHEIECVFVDHNTETSRKAKEFVTDLCERDNTTLKVFRINRSKDKSESWEEYWRKERLSFFHSLNEEIITGHNLDDCVETWIMSSLHGNPKIIPYRNKNIIRPFLLTKKEELRNWCIKNSIDWIEDESNQDDKYTRNHIRNNMMPDVLKVNPGIHKTISKKIIEMES